MKDHPVIPHALPFLLVLAAWPLAAEVVQIKLPPETASFKPGPGSEIANGQCLTCHSVEYVTSQAPLPPAFWAASVKKMRQSYGAPIPEEQVAPLLDYLSRNYGSGTNAASPSVPSLAPGGIPATTAGPALAGQTVAARYGCVSCHKVSDKLVGPPFKDIAAKYRRDANAFARIAEQIHQGGSGKWGSVIMPPFPMATDAEIKSLADWILSCK